MRGVWSLSLLPVAPAVAAEEAQAPAAFAAPAFGASTVLETLGGLVFIVALIFAVAWLARRFGQFRVGGRGVVQLLGGASVGSRERVVVVAVGGTTLVLGVAPGQVRTLHVLERDAVEEPEFAAALASEQESRQ